MKPKHYVYACVGLRPSERQEVARLLRELSPEHAFLRQANQREIPDFWIVNGDEPSSMEQVQSEGAMHVLEVASSITSAAGVYCLKRPFETEESLHVLRQFWEHMPVPLASKHSDLSALEGDAAHGRPVSWREKSGAEFGESVLTRFPTEYDSRMDTREVELTPSELAMTEDDPEELAQLRHAAVERMNSQTLDPFTDGLDMSQEWLDVMPAQILVVTDLGERAKTLPRGLRKMGFGVDVVDGFDAALTRLKVSDYKVAFLDQGVAGRFLLTWCKEMLAARNVHGEAVAVVVLGRKRTPWERWRALRAGCAAWMAAPLDRRELLAFLTEQDVERSLPRNF